MAARYLDCGHCVRLARTCLSIHKACRYTTIHGMLQERIAAIQVYFVTLDVFIKHLTSYRSASNSMHRMTLTC